MPSGSILHGSRRGFFVASLSDISITSQPTQPTGKGSLNDWQIAALLLVAASLVFIPFLARRR